MDPLLQFIPMLRPGGLELIAVLVNGQRVGSLLESPVLGGVFYESIASGMAQPYRDLQVAKQALLKAVVKLMRRSA